MKKTVKRICGILLSMCLVFQPLAVAAESSDTESGFSVVEKTESKEKEEAALTSQAEEPETEPVMGKVYLNLSGTGGRVSVETTEEDHQSFWVDAEGKTLRADNEENTHEVILTEEGYCMELQAEVGTIMLTKIEPDAGFKIATYRIMTDAGGELENIPKEELEESYEMELTVTEESQVIEVVLEEKEPTQEQTQESKDEADKKEAAKASEESETKDTKNQKEDSGKNKSEENVLKETNDNNTEAKEETQSPEEAEEEEIQVQELSDLETYLKDHADPSYTRAKKMQPVNLFLVKQTLADSEMVTEEDTIDDLFYEAETPGEAIMGVFAGTTYVYNLDDKSDYYVSFIDTMLNDPTAHTTDAVFAVNDESGTLIEGCHYDYETGIAYIPKTAYLDESGEKEVPLKIQAQLLQTFDGEDINTPIEVELLKEKSKEPETFVAESNALDVSTIIDLSEQIEGEISADELTVIVNGELMPVENCIFYEETKQLQIPVSPTNLASVEISLEKQSLFSKLFSSLFSMSEVHAMSASELPALPVEPIDFTGVAEGTIFEGTLSCEYGNNAGSSKDSYQYLYGYRGMVTESDLYDTFMAIYDFNTSLDMDNLSHAMGLCPFAVTVQDDMAAGVGGFLKIDWGDLYSYPLALQCGHISNPLQTQGTPPNAHGKIRVFTINEAEGYAIVGLITEVIYTQSGAGVYKVPIHMPPKVGSIELFKASSDPAITDNNNCYSLAGAKYGVYLDGHGDAPVAELITDENGYAKVDDLPVGQYWLKELEAPKGFAVDTSSHGVKVEGGSVATANVTDQFQYDPIQIVLKKQSEGGVQGIAPSLEGAEFTIKYYKNAYDTDPTAQGVNPERTWILKTDNKGQVFLNNSYKVSGDEFYYQGSGAAAVPFFPAGTVTIQETKAPAGYQVNPQVFTVRIETDGSNGETINTYNVPTISEPVEMMKIRLKKVDKETNGAAQGTASLQGAVYEVYDAQGTKVDTLTTDAKGEAITKDLYIGIYTLKETEASKGFLLDDTVYTVTGRVGTAIYDVISKEVPQKGQVILSKVSTENNGKPEGDATLKGAEYEMKDKDGKVVDTLITSEDGLASSKEHPLGSYTLQESKAPYGFLIDTTVYTVELTADNKTDRVFVKTVESKEVPQKGIIELQKEDSETGEVQGSASLAGAVYEVFDWNKTLVQELITDEKGAAKTEELPLGSYTIKEKTPSSGYLLDKTEYTVELTADNKADKVFQKPVTSKEQIKRGDLELTKISGGDTDHNRMAGVPFKITSKTTGENHVIVTDVNGYASTASGWNPHTQNTNEGKTDEDGVWFGEGEPDDEKGALLYDTYIIEELPCDANEDYQLIEPFEVTIYRNNRVVDLGTMTNIKTPVPMIGTTALSEQNTKELEVDSWVKIIDTVRYENLIPGKEYQLHGQLMIKETGEMLQQEGEGADITIPFTPVVSSGSVQMIFHVDTIQFAEMNLQDSSLVVFETVLLDGKEVAKHTDLTDENQTVRVKEMPEIGTTATAEDGTKELNVGEKVVLIDTVSYENLIPGEEYELFGQIIDKATGFPVIEKMEPHVTPYVTTKLFTPDRANGKVDVKFELDTTELAGKELVVYESLSLKGRTIATHMDRNDEGQTVRVKEAPEIGTTATAEDETKELKVDKEVKLQDTVAYKNLIPGKEYTLIGKVMDKETGEVLTQNGKEVTLEQKFTPKEANGSELVIFTLDTRELAGKELVVFETLMQDGREVVIHADINDENQTVKVKDVPKIGTVATAEDGTKELQIGEKTSLVDTVNYENLIPGAEYVMSGKVMVKETGKALQKDGKDLVAKVSFIPEKEDGAVQVVFTIDTTELAGKELVVFETLTKDGEEVAIHEDLEDKDQTVRVVEKTNGKLTTSMPGGNSSNGIRSVKTGDQSPILWLVMILIASAAAIGFVVICRRQAKKGMKQGDEEKSEE